MKSKAVSAMQNMVNGIINTVKSLPGKMLDIGKNIVQGIWNGISGAVGWLWNKITGFCNGIVDGIKNALGIHSPSRVFRDEVGKFLALGLGEGFNDNLKSVYKKMQSAVDFETQKLSAKISTNAELKADPGTTKTIQNNNDNGVQVTQNFYEKVQSPYETAKQTKNVMRRIAYGY